MRIASFRFAALWLTALLALQACDGPDSPTTTAADSEAQPGLRRGNGGDPQTLDPARAEDVHAFNVLADLYEGLVGYDADGALVPAAAGDWQISPDGLHYTFNLRDDGRWSDGAGVTADDFVRALRRSVVPETGSTYAFLLYPIANAARVASGDLPPEALGVTARDPLTLDVRLDEPAAHFLSVLAMPVAYPVTGAAAGEPARFRDAERFVGNGPYRLESWEPGHRARLRRNDAFREARDVTIDTVDFFPITDPLTELNMYRSGQLDITQTVPGAHFDSLRDQRPGELVVSPSLGIYYVALDVTEAPFDDRRLREAMSLAVDRERLVELLGRGELPAYGFVPDGVEGYEPARYDWQAVEPALREERAHNLYLEAGYSDAEPLEATLLYDAGDDVHETVALALAAMWRETLGAQIRIEKREWKYFLASREQRSDWDLMRFAWSGDYNHPHTFLDILRSASPQNLPGYSSAEYDAAFAIAAGRTDRAEQAQRFASAEAMMLADHPLIPLYFFVSKHLVSPQVSGFRPNALDRHPSRYLRIDELTASP